MSITIELPATFSFTSRDVEYTVGADNPVDSLPADIIAKLALHGLKQKLADALAAKDVTDPAAKVQEVYGNLVAGTWRDKREGKPGMSERDAIAMALITNAVRGAFMSLNKVKKVKELTEDNLAKIEAEAADIFARDGTKENVKLWAAVDAELAARKAAKEARELTF